MGKNKEEFPSEKDLDTKAPQDVLDEAKENKQVEDNVADLDQVFDEKFIQLQEEVATLKEQNNELEDRILRSQAELQNTLARNKKETANLLKYSGEKVLKDLLPAIDNLERALEVTATNDESKTLLKGVEMTLTQLKKALADAGVEEIKAQDEKFDPTLHQAIQMVQATDDQESDQVVQVLQTGYLYKDRLLRPAMVVVSQ